MSLPSPLCVGIDVSKATLDIAASSAIEQFSVANDADGFDSIIAVLRKHTVALVLMEATPPPPKNQLRLHLRIFVFRPDLPYPRITGTAHRTFQLKLPTEIFPRRAPGQHQGRQETDSEQKQRHLFHFSFFLLMIPATFTEL